jgi:hypothetical protein
MKEISLLCRSRRGWAIQLRWIFFKVNWIKVAQLWAAVYAEMKF